MFFSNILRQSQTFKHAIDLLTRAQQRGMVFRQGTRTLEEIRKVGGYRCSDAYANVEPWEHVLDSQFSNWISTTRNPQWFLSPGATREVKIFVIDPRGLNAQKINYDDPKRAPILKFYQRQEETVIEKSIPFSHIVAYVRLHPYNLPGSTAASWLCEELLILKPEAFLNATVALPQCRVSM